MIQLGLLGGSGRMGQWVQKLIETEFSQKITLLAAPGRSHALDSLLRCDVVIDFSLPQALTPFIETVLAQPKNQALPAFAIGSTGWTLDGRTQLERLAARTPVLLASNFSTGAAALVHALKQASPWLQQHGYVPVITERHHVHKKDAPSGTAISLQRAVSPAGPGNVQTLSVRAGEIVGDHEVNFIGANDELVFAHYAQNRSIFARGALEAALWLVAKKSNPNRTKKLYGTENLFD